MATIEIRRVTLNDIDALQCISRQTFFETFSSSNTEKDMNKYMEENLSLDKLTSELSDSSSEFYMAWQEERVIGYLKLNCGQAQTELKDGNGLEIERIYVLRKYHGQRHGQLFYEKALQIAKDKRVDYIWLGVWEENVKAMRFYLKNGFKAFDKHVFTLGDDDQTDIMMKLPLDKNVQ